MKQLLIHRWVNRNDQLHMRKMHGAMSVHCLEAGIVQLGCIWHAFHGYPTHGYFLPLERHAEAYPGQENFDQKEKRLTGLFPFINFAEASPFWDFLHSCQFQLYPDVWQHRPASDLTIQEIFICPDLALIRPVYLGNLKRKNEQILISVKHSISFETTHKRKTQSTSEKNWPKYRRTARPVRA